MEKPKRHNRKGKTAPTVGKTTIRSDAVIIISGRLLRKDCREDGNTAISPVFAAKLIGPAGETPLELRETDVPAGSVLSWRRQRAACPIDRLAACRDMGLPRPGPTGVVKSPVFRGRLLIGNGRDRPLRRWILLGAVSAQHRRHPLTAQTGQNPDGDCNHADHKQAE